MLDWTSPNDDVSPVVVAVSGSATRPRVLSDGPREPRIVATGFQRLAEALDHHRPTHVMTRALSSEFDALELGRALVGMGFDGRLVVLECDLPCIGMIRDEIADACPELSLDVLGASDGPRPALA